MMGGFGAHEYMAPCAAGENDVALSDAGYAANVEVASAEPQPVEGLPAPSPEPEEVETPGATTIEAVCGLLGRAAGRAVKAFPVVVEGRGPVLVVVRGDHRLNEIKLQNALGGRSARPRRRRCATTSAQPGFIGPVGAPSPRAGRRGAARPRAGSWRAATSPTSTWRASSRARLRARVGRRAQRGGGRPRPGGQRDPDRAGHRGGQHLQARHALLRAAGRPLPRRGRAGAADLDGLLRHRPGRTWRPRSSSSPTSRASRGRARWRPSTSSS